MEGVLPAAQNGDLPPAVEEGVAGGAVAHPVALQFLEAGQGRGGPGGPGGQNDRVGGEFPVQRFDGQLVGEGQADGLRLDEFDPHGLRPLDAPLFQLSAGDGLGEAVIVLDALGPGQSPRPPGQHGGVDPGAGGIQRGRDPRGAGANDYNIRHNALLTGGPGPPPPFLDLVCFFVFSMPRGGAVFP